MAANLNYGSFSLSTQHQRDNCQPEKYCNNDGPINCNAFGGLYQWDEMMHYSVNPGIQGSVRRDGTSLLKLNGRLFSTSLSVTVLPGVP